MTDLDALVTRLRTFGAWDDIGDCSTCQTMREAADAIERLAQERDRAVESEAAMKQHVKAYALTADKAEAALAQMTQERDAVVEAGAAWQAKAEAELAAARQERDNWRGVATVAMEDRDRLTRERDDAVHQVRETLADMEQAAAALSALAQERDRLAQELADSRINHIDANQRHLRTEAERDRLAQENERLRAERDRICRLWYDSSVQLFDDAMWLMLKADQPEWVSDRNEVQRRAADARFNADLRARAGGGERP